MIWRCEDWCKFVQVSGFSHNCCRFMHVSLFAGFTIESDNLTHLPGNGGQLGGNVGRTFQHLVTAFFYRRSFLQKHLCSFVNLQTKWNYASPLLWSQPPRQQDQSAREEFLKQSSPRYVHTKCLKISNNQYLKMTFRADWGSKRMLSWKASSAWRCPTVLTIRSFQTILTKIPQKLLFKQSNVDLYPVRNPCSECRFVHTNLETGRLHHLPQGGTLQGKRSGG